MDNCSSSQNFRLGSRKPSISKSIISYFHSYKFPNSRNTTSCRGYYNNIYGYVSLDNSYNSSNSRHSWVRCGFAATYMGDSFDRYCNSCGYSYTCPLICLLGWGMPMDAISLVYSSRGFLGWGVWYRNSLLWIP